MEEFRVPRGDEALKACARRPLLVAVGKTKLRAAAIVMRRRHPKVCERLFRRVDLSAAPEQALQFFLIALDDLDPKSDAMATLEGLGFTKELRARLDLRQGLPAEGVAKDASADVKALLLLREWTDSWTGLAREVLSSREHLIRLGLARRKPDDAARAPL